MIEETDDGYYLRSVKTKKNLGGPYKTREEAVAREKQVNYFKNIDKIKTAAGRGMPKIDGGGEGSYTKLPSLAGQAKSDLTNATKDIGEDAKDQDIFSKNFPATAKFYKRKNELEALYGPIHKQSNVSLGNVQSYLGCQPGVWYGHNTFSPENETRIGNLITGVGLTGVGLAAIPALQAIWPERFKRKTKPLATLAAVGGMAAPWLFNMASTSRDISNLHLPSFGSEQPAVKTAEIGYGLPIGKGILAQVLSDKIRSGDIDHGQAYGLMQAAVSEAPNKPWVTVGDLARAAVGAGAGALAGSVAAKGIGMFMNVSPQEQKYLQGTGAALGTLITLGKLGF